LSALLTLDLLFETAPSWTIVIVRVTLGYLLRPSVSGAEWRKKRLVSKQSVDTRIFQKTCNLL